MSASGQFVYRRYGYSLQSAVCCCVDVMCSTWVHTSLASFTATFDDRHYSRYVFCCRIVDYNCHNNADNVDNDHVTESKT